MLTKEQIVSFLDWHEINYKSQHDERLMREVCHQAVKAESLQVELDRLKAERQEWIKNGVTYPLPDSQKAGDTK